VKLLTSKSNVVELGQAITAAELVVLTPSINAIAGIHESKTREGARKDRS
jgi:hypothetical protein